MAFIGNSLAQGLISGANIQDGTVDTPDIATSAVSTAKVADNAVTTLKLNSAGIAPTITGGTINGAVIGGTTAAAGSFLGLSSTSLAVNTTALVSSGTNNIGINTASPLTNGATYGTLTINGSNGGAIQFATAGTSIAQIYNDGNALFINPSTGKTLSLQVASSTVASIGSTGISVTGILSAQSNNTHAGGSTFDSTGTTQLWLRDTDATVNTRNWGFQVSGGDFNILRANDDKASGFVTPITMGQAPANSLVILSSGTVGVGLGNPSGKFEVSGGRSWFTAGSEVFSLAFRYSSSSGVMYLGATNSVSTPSIQFSNSGGGPLVTINYAGNVGIGTTDPVSKFEVYDSAVNAAFVANTPSTWRVAQIRHDQTGTNGTAAGIAFVGKSDTQPAGIVAINGNTTGGVVSLAFLTVDSNATAERMRITSSGNVGIGTSGPTVRLHVASTETGYASTSAESVSKATLLLKTHNSDSTVTSFGGLNAGHAYIQRTNGSGSSQYSLALNPFGGNVGIGTISPVAQLDIENSSVQPFGTAAQLNAVFKGSVSIGQGGAIGFDYFGSHTNSPTSIGYAVESQAGNTKGSLVFGTRSATTDIAPVERMRINSNGSLLIGQTNTYNGAGFSIQPNLATAAVGINGNFATVWNIPTGTCGLFTVHMGGNGQYGGAALFFVTWGAHTGINNASITQIVGPQGDQSGYSWSYNLASNGQFQMRNNTNTVNFTPVINLITLG